MILIDKNKNIHDICKENPEVIHIMKKLGFENISEPGMLNTVGRFMTIQTGAAMKKISMDLILEEFGKSGFIIE